MRDDGGMASAGFSWDELRLVLAIAEAGGLGGAADRLGVNASTVFRRLGQLEDRLGRALFERHRTGYVPTPAGADMADLGRRMDEEVSGLSRRLAGTAGEVSGEIRVTTNDALLAHLLAPLLAAFRESHPAVTLEVLLSNGALNLSRRDADVALRATDRPPETLVGRRLGAIGWTIYGARDRYGDAAPDLGAVPWVGLGGQLAGRDRARLRLPEECEPRIVCRVDSVLSLIALVEAGVGVGALPCFAADRMPSLVRLAEPLGEAATSLWLLTHPDLRQAPRIRAFLDFLASRIGGQRALLAGEAPP